MSVLGKKWKIINEDSSLSLREKLFFNRDLKTEEEVKNFIDIEKIGGLHDPFLMKDMEKAIERLIAALDSQEKIIIFGDYDVDGITGAAILIHTLQLLGGNVSYRIPNRVKDGYGLNMKFIEEFIKINIGLVVTVDCGISCKNEVTAAAEGGVDVIITDHHTVPEEAPTDAVAIVHPLQKDCPYPFKGLTGSAVAFKVAHALLQKTLPQEQQEEFVESLMDLASMGTVADCGPLVGENRYIVKKGLKVLRNTKWDGLRSLMEKSGLGDDQTLDASSIGFRIAPRINAAGRISNPLFALQLLLQEEGSGKAEKLAEKLESINQTRRDMLDKSLSEAHDLNFEEEKIIIGWDSDWHVGILGLIAGRLCNDHGLPSIIMQDQGERLVGSARSNEHFNVVEALEKHSSLLNHFGGHFQAAGFDLDKKNLESFAKEMRNYAKEKLKDTDLRPILNMECEIGSKDINWETLSLLEELGPYGISNEEPSFLMSGAEVIDARAVGNDKRHLAFSIKLNGVHLKAIAFGMGEFVDYVKGKEKLDLVCRLQKNVWNGKESIQLIVSDLH